MKHVIHTLAIVAAALPFAAAAQTPTAFAERSQLIGTGQEVHLYGLSTKDSSGKIRCYDVTTTFTIGNNGRPADTASVTSEACPKVRVNVFVPGVYDGAGNDWTCSLQSSPFSGRTQVDLRCIDDSDTREYAYTWWTGPIAGHPLEPELTAAGLNTLPGNDQLSWGRITRSGFSAGCTTFSSLLGARQTSNFLDLSVYGADTTLDCTTSFVKTTP